MGVELKSNYSLYSKENLEFLSEKVGGEKDSLKEFADTNKENIFTKFGKYLLDESVKLNSDSVMKEEKSKYTDFSQIDKDYKNKVIEERSKFFQEKFLPFLKNPADMETKISLKKCDQVENDADWRNCFKKDDIQKSLKYRNKWYELASEETKEIIEKSGKNKKNKSNNDSYGDHEEVFSKDDRYEAAKKRIEKMPERYKDENNNYDILNDNKEDYSTTTFLKALNEFLGKSDNNPLGSDSNLQKFLDANFSQLRKVLGSGALGGKKSSEEDGEDDEYEDEDDEENLGGDGEENYLKNLQKEASSDKASKKVKEIYNVKKVLLQYLFDMANMDLDFCYGKVKICSEGSESEENNDKENEENEEDEDENENSDNGIFSKIAIGLKMGSEYIKGKLQQGYGTLIKNFYDIDSYDNYCGFLVNMISNLGNQIEDIGAVNVDSEDKEEEQKGDKNKNDDNSASGNERVKKEIFYDPYWYIDYLSKSEGKDKEKDHKNAKKLKNYYLNRAKLLKLYEYLGDEKNVNPRQILERSIPELYVSVNHKAPEAPEASKTKNTLKEFNDSFEKRYKNQEKYGKLLDPIWSLERDIYIRKINDDYVPKISKQISDLRRKIKSKIQGFESEIKDKIETGKKKCEENNKKKYDYENNILKKLSDMHEFSDSEKEFSEMFSISRDDYFKATGESVLEFSVESFVNIVRSFKEKILIGDEYSEDFKCPILDEKNFKKIESTIEKNFPESYDKIDKVSPGLSKYFDDDSDFFKDFLKTDEEKKAEAYEKKAQELIKGYGYKEIDLQKKQKIDLTKLQGIDENEKKKLEAQNKEIDEYNKKIDEYKKEKETFLKTFGVKLKKVGSFKINKDEEIKANSIIKANEEKKNAENKRIEEENRKKEEEKKVKEAEARSTPEGFLTDLAKKFQIKDKNKVMDELKKKLVDDRKNDANAKNSEKIYEKLKNRYEELKQKESEKAAEAFQKSLAEEAPPKKLLRDFYTPKESYKIDSLLFTEKKENLVSYDKYVIMANDENPSPRRYLSFLGMRDISELEAAYKNFETYSDKEKYKANLDYYKKQYGEAITRQRIEYQMGQINQIKTKTSPLALPDDNYYKNQEEQTSKKK